MPGHGVSASFNQYGWSADLREANRSQRIMAALIAKSAQNPESAGIFRLWMCYDGHAAEEVAKTRLAFAPDQREVIMLLLKTTRSCWYLVALLTIIVVAMPEAAYAQRGPGQMASPGLRDACRAQVRAMGIRGMAGGNAERHRFAVFRQCMAKRGAL